MKLAHLFLGWIGNQVSIFPQYFHGPLVSQGETPTTVLHWTNVPFKQNNHIKFELSTFWLAWTKLAQFFLGWIGNQVSVFHQTFHGLQCHKMKLIPQFLAEPIYLLDKTNRWNLKFWPILSASAELAHFILSWIGNQESVFPQTFHRPSLSQDERLWKDYEKDYEKF